jgi:hypothetical protein
MELRRDSAYLIYYHNRPQDLASVCYSDLLLRAHLQLNVSQLIWIAKPT